MKRLRVSKVRASRAALELAESEDDRSEAIGLLRGLAKVGVQFTAWEQHGRVGGWWSGVAGSTTGASISIASSNDSGEEGVIAIGSTKADLALRETAAVYFHVGAKGDLCPRAGVSVPLTDQGVAGLLNALRWSLDVASGIDLVQIGDLVDHARRCAASYRSHTKPAEMEDVAREMSSQLRADFPIIEAVLGTGFPFYCVDVAQDPTSRRYPVPESIKHFTATQADFFASKLAPSGVGENETVTIDELRSHGSDPGHSQFNAYEYTRWGLSPPSPPRSGELQDFYAANALEPAERIWPCDICTTVHDPAKFPRQAWIRDFMQSCAECGQTAFLPRAVGVLGADIDLIVVADVSPQGRVALAERIGRWIDNHPRAYRHDTHWSHQLQSGVGPLDVFTVANADFWSAMRTIASGEGWMDVTVPCEVGWLPITHIDYEIGKYFPLCVELLDAPSDGVTQRFNGIRASFARAVEAAEVLAAYSHDSFYLQQLGSNATIQDLLESRNRRWANSTSDS
jgi:hypothetical protein